MAKQNIKAHRKAKRERNRARNERVYAETGFKSASRMRGHRRAHQWPGANR